MQEFNKTKCLNNIYYLAKQKEIKIGDLERQAGVSVGYMSRLNKEDNNANPGLEFLISAANTLNVSLDSLCFMDYSAVSATESYILSFLDRLLEKTHADQLLWQKKQSSELYDCYHSDLGLSDTSTGERWYVESKAKFEKKFSVCGAWFTVKIPDKNGSVPLYLMRLAGSNNNAGNPSEDCYRLFLIQDQHLKLLAASEVALFHSKLVSLYLAANESFMHPRLEPDVKDVIDAFMNDSSGKDDSLPEFPF